MFSIVPSYAQRGIIVDRRGRVLAASNKIETAFAEPRALSNIEYQKEAAGKLQQILGTPGHLICKTIQEASNPGYVKLKTDISSSEREQLLEENLYGIGIQSSYKRYYPAGRTVCHVVGFAGADNKGLAGVELEFDDRLRGKAGRETFFVDAARKPIGIKQRDNSLSHGCGVVLTIDETIQQLTRGVLERQMEKYRAESAVSIVMDPFMGEVLAMVSLPDFDPGNISIKDMPNLRNRALTDPFEPGSIFKPIVAAAALDEGVITTSELIYCERGHWDKYRIGEWGSHSFGEINVKEIIAESSNIGMAKIGKKMGREKLYDSMKLFGFGERTGIELPGEDPGILYPTSKWSGYSVTRIPYGHEILVTALQVARAYSTLANGGRAVKPRIVKAIVDSEGNFIERINPPSLAGQIIKPEVANWIVIEALREVVLSGTGTRADSDKYKIFGKTGTANIARPEGGYDEENYTTSFVGGAPLEKPRVVVLVSIRKPDKSLRIGYSGGRVAAPAAKEIIEMTLDYLDVEPDNIKNKSIIAGR
jgi:cell division protein FtsI/penicillin-binding protein 2